MNYFFVTGSSKGLGLSFVNELLLDKNNSVFAYSRNNSLKAENYEFIAIDLSNIDLLNNFNFPTIQKADKITLINNAGVIGDVKPTGSKQNSSITETYVVNTIAPSILMNQFIAQFQKLDCEKTILNISSGAGRHTITSWADYCASKSALDLFSLVIFEEQKNQKYPINIFSVAPGIIDTNMQDEIRNSSKEDFENIDYFVDLKKNNLLISPKVTALKILEIINNPQKYESTILDIRDY